MIRLEPNMTFDDVRQWLNNGWFWFVASSRHKRRVAWMLDWKNEPDTYYIIEDIDGEKFTMDNIEDSVFPHWPILGSLNLPTLRLAVDVRRQQLKQWRRTYNAHQLRLRIPYKWQLLKRVKTLGTLSRESRDLTRAAFDPNYPTSMEETGYMFSDGWHSVAINSRVIIVNTYPRRLYYRGQLAACVDRSGVYSDPINEELLARIQKSFPGGIHV